MNIDTFRYQIMGAMSSIPAEYSHPSRYYHGASHIKNMLAGALALSRQLCAVFSDAELESLVDAILFHDIVYVPGNEYNEARSIEVYQDREGINPTVEKLIRVTSMVDAPADELERVMCYLDLGSFLDYGEELWKDMYAIFKEFAHVPFCKFVGARKLLLEEALPKWVDDCFQDKSSLIDEGMQQTLLRGIDSSSTLLKLFRPKIGIYVGSFNPLHAGHIGILREAERIFDKVIVVQAINLTKSDVSTFDITKDWDPAKTIERWRYGNQTSILDILEEIATGNAEYTMIRGIRNTFDLQEELNYQAIIKDMGVNIPVIMLAGSSDRQHISSTAMRSLNKIGIRMGNWEARSE